jgi:hypothetical protein
MSPNRCLARIFWVAAALAAAGAQSAEPTAHVVQDDWYFRESLTAIRDWEAILSRWEQTMPEAQRTPVLPLPENGDAVAWTDPIPAVLVPSGQRAPQVRVRLAGAKVEIQRQRAFGPPTTETTPLGPTVLAYKHPGGGGKDQWYHKYDRKFDRLTTFRARPAPFALALPSTLDFRRGHNTLAVELRNVSAKPIAVTLELQSHTPKESHPCGQKAVSVAAGKVQSVPFPVDLREAGGTLMVLTAETGGQSFWLPVCTYVEDVASVLAGIEQLLADTPDAHAAERLAGLRARAEQWRPSPPDAANSSWSALFREASALRDELLLKRIGFDTLLFIKRKPFYSEQPFMDAHHLYNRPGGAIWRLSPVRPTGKTARVVDSLGEGVYRDLCLHWDAKRFLFAFGNGSDSWDGAQSYHVYECGLDGAPPRQLTTGPKNDCEPFYLPDDGIGFTSDRSEHFVMCGGDRHAPTLFAMRADGSEMRRLSHNMFNDFTPAMLDDGRILYSRWEYNERSVTSLHHPFTMRPDGSMVAPYYGNATIRPNVVMFARPVPESRKVMALFTAHHGQTHGTVGLIDVRRGIDGPGPLELLTPGVPLTGEKAEDSRCGWFSDPVPLSESTWLCSFTPTVLPWLEWTWALYVADRHGQLALVYRDREISCAEPVPLVPRKRPHLLPSRGTSPSPPAENGRPAVAREAEATLVLGDVHLGLPGVPRGTARYLRILEDVPRKGVHSGGVVRTSGTSIYTVKRIFGTVPIEADGSAHFLVPADRNVYFEVLDAQQREIQRMRSVVCLKAGETRTCIGCHERVHTAPPAQSAAPVRQALGHPASRPVPPPWGTQIVSFLRDVQPVLNAKCIACHTHDRTANRVILTDDLTDQFTVGYEELLPYLSVANSMRWDHPEDVLPRPPYTYGSKVSRLSQVLDAGHHGVKLTEEEGLRLANWIDANGVYYDRYETAHYPDRRIFTGAVLKPLGDVFSRRCISCHGGGRRGDPRALSLNRRDVKLSRALAAPLARAAGGWERCGPPVFADANDPDYRALLATLTKLRDGLQQAPREDLLSIRGTPAESQPVDLPPPPPRRPASGALLSRD